jgi:transcriptional regulator with XRE-family HTH domain
MSSISPNYFGMSDSNHSEVKSLKALLEERAINKTKLAERMGIGRTTLSQWEKGTRNISFEHAISLASHLQVSLLTLGKSLGYDVSGVPGESEGEQN